MGDQIPQLSPHAEVRKIGNLTLYIAYENTWNLVQIECPTLGTKFCIKSLDNVPPIPVLGGVGLNIDRCISYSGMMFSCVLAYTLLHHELDYSLGQMTFAVFRALFAITQLLCHVSA